MSALFNRGRCLFLATLSVMSLTFTPVSQAASVIEIDIGVRETLKKFATEVSGGADFLKQAKAVLVFPKVIKAGFGIGAEYGEGALQVNGRTVDYYSTAAASIGLQAGAQSKAMVMVFLEKSALQKFRESSGWKAGIDGSVAVVEWGAAEDINTIDFRDPIVGFVFDNRGLMFNLTLEGAKFTRLNK